MIQVLWCSKVVFVWGMCCFSAIMFSGNMAMAQLNESDTAVLQLRTGLSGTWQQGNVELWALRTRLEVVSNSRKAWVYKTQNNSLYQAFGGKKADNDISSRNYLYYNPQQRWYPFAIGYWQTNYRRQLLSRWFAGAGGTWQIFNRQHSNLKLSGSMVYEQSRFSTAAYNEAAYNGSKQIALWRATLYLAGRHLLFHQRMRVYYMAYWQPGLGNIPNYRSQIDAGIDFPLWMGLNATLVWSYSREAVVPEKVKQKDSILTFGLSYQWKKAKH